MSKIFKLKTVPQIKRIPSGIYVFDLLTGGGIPEGRVTLFYGDKSTNKTTLATRLVGTYLRKNPDKQALYIDFEGALDPKWTETLLCRYGDVSDRLLVSQPAYAEEGIEVAIESLQTPDIGIYIVDSIAMMVPIEEVDGDVDQKYVGILARTANKLLRKFVYYMAKWKDEGHPITVILINQLRTAISRGGPTSFMPSHTKPGGKLQDAMASMVIKFYVHKTEEKTINKQKLPMRIWYSFIVEKNKVGGAPKITGAYPMSLINTDVYKVGDICDAPQIVNLLKDTGLLEKEKSKYVLLGENYATQKEIFKKLTEDYDFKVQVLQELYKNNDILLATGIINETNNIKED